MGAARSVQFELSSLELRDEDNPEVLIAFQARNGSPLKVELENLDFSLYLNGQFIGSNYTPFTKRTLDGFEEATMNFVIPIRPFFFQYVEQARQKEDFSWSVNGRAKLLLPPKEKGIWLDIREHWSGN